MRNAAAFACALLLAATLPGCGPPLVYGPSEGSAPAPVPGAGEPQPATQPSPPAGAAAGEPGARPGAPARPAPRVARLRTLSPAVQALIVQARGQSAGGNFALAAATLERALRIEPEHPQIWLELGKVRQAQHNYAQAEVMGRKALAASDDRSTQAAAWRLIAESLRAQGRRRQAGEADERARSLASMS